MYSSVNCEKLTIKELRKRAEQLNQIYKTNIKGRAKIELCKQIEEIENKYKEEKEEKKEDNNIFNDNNDSNNINDNNDIINKSSPLKQFSTTTEAINYLDKIISNYPLSNLCTGVQVGLDVFDRWIRYLIQDKQISSSICVAPIFELLFDRNIYDISPSKENYNLNSIKKINEQIITCKNTNILIPLEIFSDMGFMFKSKHRNMVLINTKTKTYEWFEPEGYDINTNDDSNRFNIMIKFFENQFPKLFNLTSEYKFISAYGNGCPLILGPQNHSFEKPLQRNLIYYCNRNRGGYCVTYSTIYAHLRCLAPDTSVQETVESFMNLGNHSIMDFVLRYISWQLDILGEEQKKKEYQQEINNGVRNRSNGPE